MNNASMLPAVGISCLGGGVDYADDYFYLFMENWWRIDCVGTLQDVHRVKYIGTGRARCTRKANNRKGMYCGGGDFMRVVWQLG